MYRNDFSNVLYNRVIEKVVRAVLFYMYKSCKETLKGNASGFYALKLEVFRILLCHPRFSQYDDLKVVL